MRTYAYRVWHKNGWGTGLGPRPTHCHKCACKLLVKGSGGTGYGCGKSEQVKAPPGAPPLKLGESYGRSPAFCYQCCADDEKARMIETGRAVLYLTKDGNAWRVSDWSGKLSFPVRTISKGAHNMARTRYDVAFTGPDGKPWRGTQYGENTQICHCRRLGK